MDHRSRPLAAACLAASLMIGAAVHAAEPRPDQVAFREIYRELVETNTTLSAGSCTAAAEKMAARLRAAGYPESDLHLFAAPDHPKEGGLVAVLPGSDAKARPMLLLAHIDVVEARREDWQRDPFTLVEEDGYFYARGAIDDKSMAATWVDTLIRLRSERTRLRRTVKMALTCGEETNGAFNGAEYLVKEKRDLIDAAFALNEGAWGVLDPSGKRVMMGVQAGEKTSQNFRLEVQNPGGHSSRPVKNNAIYRLAGALTRIEHYDFPINLNDTTRTYFTRMASIVGGEAGAAMTRLVADPSDSAAGAKVAEDPSWNGMLRTTCVATMLDAGHATNALPQRARATVNCRIYPGESIENVQQTLERVVADEDVKVTTLEVRGPASAAPALTKDIMGPIEKVSARLYPRDLRSQRYVHRPRYGWCPWPERARVGAVAL
jgi:acetylornithine deacetylase/succinyl-diaminopimelate desuccinylase-like protein